MERISEQDQLFAHQKQHEKGHNLLEAKIALEQQLEVDGRTDPTHLDKLLEVSAAFYQWRMHHPVPDQPPEVTAYYSEQHAEQLLKLQGILRGTYQNEKANYFLEKAQVQQEIAKEDEKKLQDAQEGTKKDETLEEIQYARKVAVNYLRTAANCIEMKTARPPEPGQQEKRP